MKSDRSHNEWNRAFVVTPKLITSRSQSRLVPVLMEEWERDQREIWNRIDSESPQVTLNLVVIYYRSLKFIPDHDLTPVLTVKWEWINVKIDPRLQWVVLSLIVVQYVNREPTWVPRSDSIVIDELWDEDENKLDYKEWLRFSRGEVWIRVVGWIGLNETTQAKGDSLGRCLGVSILFQSTLHLDLGIVTHR